ncbi:helix-turn-helix domain-containing protein [uncultured Aquimarina sp.]|uniref:helix-turn-helix domain-containing protein n=1 Tax=uncultured Aquimarina sp. TaxID=575652 RepID=UPI00260E6AB1|nr:helix-turn-helix domain-containing protein [uncultured Aquimarina sp.]
MNGILICLYSQLIILGIFNILNRRLRNIILGSLCCLLAMSFIYTIYWPKFNMNLSANILLGGYKHMFLPSLIYLYMLVLIKKNQNHLILKNLIPPIIVHSFYLSVKFGFNAFYISNIINLVGFINIFIFASYLFYFIKGLLLLKELKIILLPPIHKRYTIFFVVMSLYGIVLVSEAIIPFLFGEEKLKATSSFLSSNFYINIAIIVNLGMLVFAFIESPSLKPILLGEKIYTGFDTIKNNEKIIAFINDVFDTQKLFLNTDFDLKLSLKASQVNEKEFKLFLKKEFNKSPIEFINTYRVEAFKKLVALSENNKYSLLGIANKVGFNSKATFYRNFKNIEGVTPKEYLQITKNIE